MLKVTLEWNAVVTLENPERSGHESLKKLIKLHGNDIEVGIVTTAASENSKDQSFPRTGIDFLTRIKSNNIEHLPLVLQPAVGDIIYIGLCALPSSSYETVAQEIWKIIPPANLPWDRKIFALQERTDPERSGWSPEFKKWRNKWCDVNSIYTHIWHQRDVFVSGDEKNFKDSRRERLRELGVGEILTYDQALEYCIRNRGE